MKAYKYQGAGNDFVILDNREEGIELSSSQIKLLCDRRFGIGSDGLMLLEGSKEYDFKMRYFNADGFEGTMCGNGGRCLVAFAAKMGIRNFDFEAIDGFHTAKLIDYTPSRSIVRLKMKDVEEVRKFIPSRKEDSLPDAYFLDTGSAHLVIFVESVDKIDVATEGKFWRYYPDFENGVNVNFVEFRGDKLYVRTFERGVEAETFACGTGVTASSIAAFILKGGQTNYTIQTLGDLLQVEFTPHANHRFSDIWLTGPATFVFETEI